jgi:aryl-alcohol dehydrogenase-like predicted oxidoreductase
MNNPFIKEACHPDRKESTQKNHQNGCMYRGIELLAKIPVLNGILTSKKLPSSNRSAIEFKLQLQLKQQNHRLKQFKHDLPFAGL